MKSSYLIQNKTKSISKRSAFTLVEVLVAVAIMSLLFAVILVPLRLAFDTLHIGKARSEVQQQAQVTLGQIAIDLRKAQFVFPNSYIKGISDNKDSVSNCSPASYKGTDFSATDTWKFRPYVRTTNSANTGSPSTYGVCSTPATSSVSGIESWDNPSRIDMLQLRRDNDGAGLNSVVGQDYLITYYPRRLDITKAYDIIDNPVVLFRAQYAFRERDSSGNPSSPYKPNGTDYNARINWLDYPTQIGSCSGQSNNDFRWITHNFYGEADLSQLTGLTPKASNVEDAHTLATPRGMGLVAPRSNTLGSSIPSDAKDALVPELSFVEESTNGKRINRVTVNMTLAQYDLAGAGSVNGQGAAQRVRVSQTIDLPNTGCSP